jgi:hypothetical protein
MNSGLLALILPALLSAQSDTPQAADAAYERKDYTACGAIFSRLGHQANNTTWLYNAAACFALGGNKDAAFALLDELVALGWMNTRLLRDDPDFQALRDDRRWAGVLAGSEANWKKKFGNDNAELWSLRDGDDADRQPWVTDLAAAVQRDRARLARVKEIVAAGGLKTANDYFNAAMLHQHGIAPDDFLQARALALRAAEMDPANARAKWLAAAAQDRYLRSIGKPQIYGTQFKQIDGVWQLEPVDESAVTDEERAKWNVPPLADAKRRAAAMNKTKPGAPP